MRRSFLAIDSSSLIPTLGNGLLALFALVVLIAIIVRVVRALVLRKPGLIKSQVLQPLFLPADVQHEVFGVRPSDNSDLAPRTEFPSNDRL